MNGMGQTSNRADRKLPDERRRAGDLVALAEMIQDAFDQGGLGDEAHHAHLAATAKTHERVDFVHSPDQMRPPTPEGRPLSRVGVLELTQHG